MTQRSGRGGASATNQPCVQTCMRVECIGGPTWILGSSRFEEPGARKHGGLGHGMCNATYDEFTLQIVTRVLFGRPATTRVCVGTPTLCTDSED